VSSNKFGNLYIVYALLFQYTDIHMFDIFISYMANSGTLRFEYHINIGINLIFIQTQLVG
jgi:hypothetical protein